MGKRIAVVIRHTPFNSERNSEALRMGVGLTTAEEHQVSILFLGDGVLTLRSLAPAVIGADDVGKHLEACRMLGIRVVAEHEALRRYGVKQSAVPVERASFEETWRAIAAADVVIPF